MFGVEQFDQGTAGHVVLFWFSSFTVRPQQQKEQWSDKSVDGVNYLHFGVFVLITDTREMMSSKFTYNRWCRFRPITAWQVLKHGTKCRHMIGRGVVATPEARSNICHTTVLTCVSIQLWAFGWSNGRWIRDTAGDNVKLFLKAFGTIVIVYNKRRANLYVCLIYASIMWI